LHYSAKLKLKKNENIFLCPVDASICRGKKKADLKQLSIEKSKIKLK
jgi:hypothetical protein